MVDMRGKHFEFFCSNQKKFKNFQGLMKLVLCFITWVNAEGAQNNAFKNALSGTPIISGPVSDYA